MRIVTLCTGNVARSVMLGFMLAAIGDAEGVNWSLRTAGTQAVEGLAMSGRTRDALRSIDELGAARYGAHRSHQVTEADLAWADVVLALEANHVRFVRSAFPLQADKAVQVLQFVRRAPLDGPLEAQIAAVVGLELEDELDVVDPTGEQSSYDACAAQLWELAQAFAVVVAATAD